MAFQYSTHKKARERLFQVLCDNLGYSQRDASQMISRCLKAIKESPTEAIDACQLILGLEFEYISPLLQDDREMVVDHNGKLRIKNELAVEYK